MTDTLFTVTENQRLCRDVYKLILQPDKYISPRGGQFINIEVPGRRELLLRRPFAICDYDDREGTVTVCFKTVGEGTDALSNVQKGDRLRAVYPLGNGFTLQSNHKKVLITGGGAGIFPLLAVTKSYPEKSFYTFLGFKSKDDAVLIKDFEDFSRQVLVCTEDSSLGSGGYVTDLIKSNIDKIDPDVILACGPKNMFIALKNALAGKEIPVFVSLEERMGCGIGACIVCTCAIKTKDGAVKNRRVCRDGPVFRLDEVVL